MLAQFIAHYRVLVEKMKVSQLIAYQFTSYTEIQVSERTSRRRMNTLTTMALNAENALAYAAVTRIDG